MEQSTRISRYIGLVLRLVLSYIFLLLGFRHLTNPTIFYRTLELPVTEGILFRWLYSPILENSTLFTTVRIITGIIELTFGILLLLGIFPRLLGMISTGLLVLITLSLIPSWFMFFVHSLSLSFSISLIFVDATLYSLPIMNTLPEKWRWMQKPAKKS